MRSARRPELPRLLTGVLALLSALGAAQASAETGDTRLHARLGPLRTSYSGPVANSYTVPTTFDLEYERFLSSRHSFALRTILSHDFTTARLMYGYAGVGLRRYLFSQGTGFEAANEAFQLSSLPRLQYYVSGDAGISQVVVRTIGTVYQASSALMDFALGGGANYRVSRGMGVEAHLAYGMGFGFSTVAVAESSLRLFFGVSWNL